MKEYQVRSKFFVNWGKFQDWSYPDKRGIGVNLKDFAGKNDPTWTFIVEGKTFEISAEKGKELGKKYVLSGNFPMPNIIPVSEFHKSYEEVKPLSMQLSFI